ncbi:hypothetical protein MRB53_011261 [Persea americana]|uniref:Uncharacterized protein n=1 Tax=Persea americana TaxID=3435 RepID=A0ACC2LUI0_PERAE|nr:hypothetical protein MRB53_011261 [Persea americana]
MGSSYAARPAFDFPTSSDPTPRRTISVLRGRAKHCRPPLAPPEIQSKNPSPLLPPVPPSFSISCSFTRRSSRSSRLFLSRSTAYVVRRFSLLSYGVNLNLRALRVLG